MRPRIIPCCFAVTASLVGLACSEPAGLRLPPNPAIVPSLLAAVDSVLNARPLVIQGTMGLEFHPQRDGALVFADSLLGRTFEWDSTRNTYAATGRPGAPNRGVRAILYAPDAFGTTPIRPYVEVGSTDQIHESPGTAEKLRTIVRDHHGLVFGNYLVSAVAGTSAFEIAAVGQLVLDDKGLEVEARITSDNDGGTTEYTLALPSRGLQILSRVTGARTTTGRTATATYILRQGGVVLDMLGTITDNETAPGVLTSTANVTLRLNGGVFATITGTVPDIMFLDEHGDPLLLDDFIVVSRVFRSPDRLHAAIARLLQPSVNLLSGLTP